MERVLAWTGALLAGGVVKEVLQVGTATVEVDIRNLAPGSIRQGMLVFGGRLLEAVKAAQGRTFYAFATVGINEYLGIVAQAKIESSKDEELKGSKVNGGSVRKLAVVAMILVAVTVASGQGPVVGTAATTLTDTGKARTNTVAATTPNPEKNPQIPQIPQIAKNPDGTSGTTVTNALPATPGGGNAQVAALFGFLKIVLALAVVAMLISEGICSGAKHKYGVEIKQGAALILALVVSGLLAIGGGIYLHKAPLVIAAMTLAVMVFTIGGHDLIKKFTSQAGKLVPGMAAKLADVTPKPE